jgi:hypothetical protein
MLSKLSVGLLALALLFGLAMPANAQGYWGTYGAVYNQPYVHPTDVSPYCSPYCYSPSYVYVAYFVPYYPGSPYGWWWWIAWRR